MVKIFVLVKNGKLKYGLIRGTYSLPPISRSVIRRVRVPLWYFKYETNFENFALWFLLTRYFKVEFWLCHLNLWHLRLVATRRFNFLQFQFWKWKFLIKMQCIAVHFYLGYWNQPWFGLAGSENVSVFRMCKWLLQLSFKRVCPKFTYPTISNL